MTLSRWKEDPSCLESDDDESIIYGDQCVSDLPRRRNYDEYEDSQLTQSSQPSTHPSHLSRRRAATITTPSTTTTTLTKNTTPRMIMTREERRKRRRIWRARQDELVHHATTQNDEWTTSSDEEEHHHDDDDHDDDDNNDYVSSDHRQTTDGAFASLRALLLHQDDSGQETKTRQKTAARSISRTEQTLLLVPDAHQDESMRSVQEVYTRQSQGPTEDGSTQRERREMMDESCPELSPPDFAAIQQDDDIGDDEVTTAGQVQCTPKTTMSTNNERRSSMGEYPKRLRSSSQPPSHRPTKPMTTRRHSSFHHPGTQTEPSRSLTTQLVQDETNIVGLRPNHWRRHPVNKPQPQSGFLRSAAEQSQAARMKALRAATMKSSAVLSHSMTQTIASATTTTTGTKENRKNNSSIIPPNKSTTSQRISGRRITAETLRTMSFRPLTMPKNRKESVSNWDDVSVVDIDDDSVQGGTLLDDNDRPTSLHRPSFSSSTPPRRKHRSSSNKNHGPWVKRLGTIKSKQAADALKLQHTGMNRHGLSFFDLNDPRRKAKTYTDVSILEQHDCYGVALPTCWSWDVNNNNNNTSSYGDQSHDGALLTVLCYIHNHGPINRGTPVSTKISKVYAWISLTRMTARNIGLQKGLELRLYDVILLPIRQGHASSHHPTTNNPQCRFILIRTQLCERHQCEDQALLDE